MLLFECMSAVVHVNVQLHADSKGVWDCVTCARLYVIYDIWCIMYAIDYDSLYTYCCECFSHWPTCWGTLFCGRIPHHIHKLFQCGDAMAEPCQFCRLPSVVFCFFMFFEFLITVRVLSIWKSGFWNQNPDFGFHNKTRNSFFQTDFVEQWEIEIRIPQSKAP